MDFKVDDYCIGDLCRSVLGKDKLKLSDYEMSLYHEMDFTLGEVSDEVAFKKRLDEISSLKSFCDVPVTYFYSFECSTPSDCDDLLKNVFSHVKKAGGFNLKTDESYKKSRSLFIGRDDGDIGSVVSHHFYPQYDVFKMPSLRLCDWGRACGVRHYEKIKLIIYVVTFTTAYADGGVLKIIEEAFEKIKRPRISEDF